MSALQGLKDNGEGWIEWGGGECPVAAQVWVEIRLRDGETEVLRARSCDWRHEVMYDDIIAYRIHKES